MIPLEHFIFISAFVFCVGILGILHRRNVIGLLISVELILNAANINLVAFSRYFGKPNGLEAQVFALFVIAIAAASSVVGLVLVINIYRNRKSLFTDDFHLMKE